jgi:hypothetical protein
MKQWLNTPMSYGCMIRTLLVCIFGLLLLAAAVDQAFNIGGPHWTTVSTAILAVLAIIVAPVGFILVSLSTGKPEQIEKSALMPAEQAFELLRKQEENYLKTSSDQETGTLIVSARKEHRGKTVYLLSRDEFFKRRTRREREDTKQIKRATITREGLGPCLLFVTRFRDLRPGRYNVWTNPRIDNPKSVIVKASCQN